MTTEITAETITDDQIRQLLAEVEASADPHEKWGGHTIAGSCREALGEIHLHGSTQEGARRRCANYLNVKELHK